MFLILNTSDNEKVSLVLIREKSVIKEEFEIDFFESEKILLLINRFLKKNKTKLVNLKGLGVFMGPGPFTALRVGIVVANTLAYALNIPVYGFKENEVRNPRKLRNRIEQNKSKVLIRPFYGQLPSITKPKKTWLK